MTANNNQLQAPQTAAGATSTTEPPPPWLRPLVEEILREFGSHQLERGTSPGFVDFNGLCAAVPLSARTLRELIKKRIVPHIRLSGGRRLLFSLSNVEKSLLRFEKGGIPE
ncbi:MAG: hypothetical protein EXS31_06965 [Pedosphaera sp.]|nr:hypothetical protein [Pedosphaera sp.]